MLLRTCLFCFTHICLVGGIFWDKKTTTLEPTTTTHKPTTTTPVNCDGQRQLMYSPEASVEFLSPPDPNIQCDWKISVPDQPIASTIKVALSTTLPAGSSVKVTNHLPNGGRTQRDILSGTKVEIEIKKTVNIDLVFHGGPSGQAVTLTVSYQHMGPAESKVLLDTTTYGAVEPTVVNLDTKVATKVSYVKASHENEKIYLYLTKLDIAQGSKLVVYDGHTVGEAKTLETFESTTQLKNEPIVSSMQSVALVWSSAADTSKQQEYNFYATSSAVHETCGNLLVANFNCKQDTCDLGSLSPSYNQGADCLWYILAPETHDVKVTFPVYNSNGGWSQDIFSGIGDVSEKLIVSFDSQNPAFQLSLNENAMTFRSRDIRSSATNKLTARFSSSPKTDNKLKTISDSPRGLIMSPSYPNRGSTTPVNVTWRLENDASLPQHQIEIIFQKVDIGFSNGNFIRVSDGQSLDYKIEGDQNPTLQSCTSKLTVEYYVSNPSQYDGFLALYSALDKPCGDRKGSSPDGGISTGAILAIAIGGFVVLLIVVVIFGSALYMRHRRAPINGQEARTQRRRQEDVEMQPTEEPEGEYVTDENWAQVSAAFPPPPSYQEALDAPKYEHQQSQSDIIIAQPPEVQDLGELEDVEPSAPPEEFENEDVQRIDS